jgi:hypothetical protein
MYIGDCSLFSLPAGEYESAGDDRFYVKARPSLVLLPKKYILPVDGACIAGENITSASTGLDAVREGLWDCLSGKRHDKDRLLGMYKEITGKARPEFMG